MTKELGVREEEKMDKDVLEEILHEIAREGIAIAPYAGRAFLEDDEENMNFFKGQQMAFERLRKFINDKQTTLLSEEEEKADEQKEINSLRCCNCKLPKNPGKIVCACCGGTTYEGFYDKVFE